MRKENKKFKVGDLVTWLSSWTVKVGTVVAVVSPNVMFYSFKTKKFLVSSFEEFDVYNKTKLSDGTKRDHESYLVLVKDKFLYWPKVVVLEKVQGDFIQEEK